MTEIDSFFPSPSQLPFTECGLCMKPVTFTIRGENVPVHDPITGDMICGECHYQSNQRSTQRSTKESSDRPSVSKGITAYPLYMLRENIKNVSNHETSTSESSETCPDLLHNKCIYHKDVEWGYVDMDNLICVCSPCSRQASDHDLRWLRRAVSHVRKRIASVIVTPLHIKGQSSKGGSSTNGCNEQKDNTSEGDNQVTLFQWAIEMEKTVNQFNMWVQEVMDTCVLIRNKISHLRSLVGEGNLLRRRLELMIQYRGRLFIDACHLYIQSLQSMIRIRHVISGTLLEGMRLLGLDMETGECVTEGGVLRVLGKRKRGKEVIGEEVMVLRSLSCVKETLEYGDSLLLEMTREGVEGVLNQPDGMRDLFSRLITKVKKITCEGDVRLRKEEEMLMSQVKDAFEDLVKAVPLLLVSQPEYWKTSLVEWQKKRGTKSVEPVKPVESVEASESTMIIPTLQQDEALQVVLDALVDVDAARAPLTKRAFNRFLKSKEAMGEANTLFVEGILLSHLDTPTTFTRYTKAEMLGCRHPLLYHYMGVAYHMGKHGVTWNASKALEYYEKCIAGGSMIGHIDIFNMYYFGCAEFNINEANASRYLMGLEREGYVDGALFDKIGDGYAYMVRRPSEIMLPYMYLQRAISLGYVRSYLTMVEILESRFHAAVFPRGMNNPLLILLKATEQGVTDEGVLAELLQHLSRWHPDVLIPSAHHQGRRVPVGELALYYCDVLIQNGSSLGYDWKAKLYWSGKAGLPQDMSKAVSIWEEADRLELAHIDMYKDGLIKAYIEGKGVKRNGAKVLEYCDRALDIFRTHDDKQAIYNMMADVYEKGIPPINKDPHKAKELRKGNKPK